MNPYILLLLKLIIIFSCCPEVRELQEKELGQLNTNISIFQPLKKSKLDENVPSLGDHLNKFIDYEKRIGSQQLEKEIGNEYSVKEIYSKLSGNKLRDSQQIFRRTNDDFYIGLEVKYFRDSDSIVRIIKYSWDNWNYLKKELESKNYFMDFEKSKMMMKFDSTVQQESKKKELWTQKWNKTVKEFFKDSISVEKIEAKKNIDLYNRGIFKDKTSNFKIVVNTDNLIVLARNSFIDDYFKGMPGTWGDGRPAGYHFSSQRKKPLGTSSINITIYMMSVENGNIFSKVFKSDIF